MQGKIKGRSKTDQQEKLKNPFLSFIAKCLFVSKEIE